MKKTASRIAFVIFLFSLSLNIANAQDCETYLTLQDGVEFTMESYNPKGKLQSKSEQVVTDAKQDADGNFSAQLSATILDNKDKETAKLSYAISCKDGIFYVDMQSLLAPEQLKGFENMEIEIDSDFMELPIDAQAGDELKDANLEVKMMSGGVSIMSITIDVTNRKVEAEESITTPAGTFDCLKISYDVTSTLGMPIKVRGKSTEWHARNIGVVKSESFNKNGKSQGYSLLTKHNKL